MDHMLKFKWLPDYKFSCAISVSKIIGILQSQYWESILASSEKQMK